ncbi:MAG: protein kinase, partial [archaeon]|nr:protein kinase [archaeon]
MEIRQNKISNRLFELSPMVQVGKDTECVRQNFYELKDSVNLGVLGEAKSVCHIKTKMVYTIVMLEKRYVNNEDLRKKIQNMINKMYSIHSPFVLRLLNHFENEEHLFLITEQLNGNTLENFILSQNKLKKDLALRIFTEVCLGVKKLNRSGLFNINIAPFNIILNENNTVKLTDFGLKISSDLNVQNPKRFKQIVEVGGKKRTIDAYTTPEQIALFKSHKKVKANSKLDSWNLGVLLFEMLTGIECPFETDDLLTSISKGKLNLKSIEDPFCKQIITKLLDCNASTRLSLEELLSMDQLVNIEVEADTFDESDCIINDREEATENENSNTNIEEDLAQIAKEDKDELQPYPNYDSEKNSEEKSHNSDEGINLNEIFNEGLNELDFSLDNYEVDDTDNYSITSDLDNLEKQLEKDIKKCETVEQIKEKYDGFRRLYIKKEELLNYQIKTNKELKKKIEEQEKEIRSLKDKLNEKELDEVDKTGETASKEKVDEETTKLFSSGLGRFQEFLNNLSEDVKSLLTNSSEIKNAVINENRKFIEEQIKLFYDAIEKERETNLKMLNTKTTNEDFTLLVNKLENKIAEQSKTITKLMVKERKLEGQIELVDNYKETIKNLEEGAKLRDERVQTYKKQLQKLNDINDDLVRQLTEIGGIINTGFKYDGWERIKKIVEPIMAKA